MTERSQDDSPTAAPTSPAGEDVEESLAREREGLGNPGPEDEKPVLIDDKEPGEDSAQ